MFKTDFEVRDYECDIQGRVNNAIYLNYLEHTRHLYLKSLGVNFAEMHEEGKDLVVIRYEIDYKSSLFFDDKFYVTCELVRESRLKFAFMQNIYKYENDTEKLVMKAKALGTCINPEGKPLIAEELEKLIQA